MALADKANVYIDEKKPWVVAKEAEREQEQGVRWRVVTLLGLALALAVELLLLRLNKRKTHQFRPGSFRRVVKLMTQQFVDVTFDQAAAGNQGMYLLGPFQDVVAAAAAGAVAAVVQLFYWCELVVLQYC